uniref:Uncharacterized protein n=1 Tax=Aegilops tauschii subsp. strangulata TaxID=200361 RepID=A0A453GZQ5_AEGTS
MTVLRALVLDLLLGPQLVAVATLLLAAVDSPWMQPGVALAADHLLLVVLAGEGLERGLDDAPAEAEHEVQRRLLLDVVVGQRAPVLQLLPREDQPLLVRRDPCTHAHTTPQENQESEKLDGAGRPWPKKRSFFAKRRNKELTLLVLDLGLDIVDGVAALDLERDGLARQGLDEDLHLGCWRREWSGRLRGVIY